MREPCALFLRDFVAPLVDNTSKMFAWFVDGSGDVGSRLIVRIITVRLNEKSFSALGRHFSPSLLVSRAVCLEPSISELLYYTASTLSTLIGFSDISATD